MSDEQAPLLLILWNSLITFDGTPNVFQNDQMLIRSDQILAKRHYSMDSQVTQLTDDEENLNTRGKLRGFFTQYAISYFYVKSISGQMF